MIKLNKQKSLDFVFGFFLPLLTILISFMFVAFIGFYMLLIVSIVYGLIHYPLVTIGLLIFLICVYYGFKEIQQ